LGYFIFLLMISNLWNFVIAFLQEILVIERAPPVLYFSWETLFFQRISKYSLFTLNSYLYTSGIDPRREENHIRICSSSHVSVSVFIFIVYLYISRSYNLKNIKRHAHFNTKYRVPDFLRQEAQPLWGISSVLVSVPHVFKHLSSNSSKQGSKDVMKYDRLKIGLIKKIKIEPFVCTLNWLHLMLCLFSEK